MQVIQSGVKYSRHDCILISWQADDMPNFGRIGDIIVVEEHAFFIVNVLSALGIDGHYHSFCVKRVCVKRLYLYLVRSVEALLELMKLKYITSNPP